MNKHDERRAAAIETMGRIIRIKPRPQTTPPKFALAPARRKRAWNRKLASEEAALQALLDWFFEEDSLRTLRNRAEQLYYARKAWNEVDDGTA